MAGILGPIVVAQFTEVWPGKAGWMAVFIMTAITSAISLTLWAFFQSSEVNPVLNSPVKRALR